MATEKKKVFAKGEYIAIGDSEEEVKKKVDEKTPGLLLASVPKPISRDKAIGTIMTKDGDFKKGWDWTKTKPPKFKAPKPAKSKTAKLGKVHRGRGGYTRRK